MPRDPVSFPSILYRHPFTALLPFIITVVPFATLQCRNCAAVYSHPVRRTKLPPPVLTLPLFFPHSPDTLSCRPHLPHPRTNPPRTSSPPSPSFLSPFFPLRERSKGELDTISSLQRIDESSAHFVSDSHSALRPRKATDPPFRRRAPPEARCSLWVSSSTSSATRSPATGSPRPPPWAQDSIILATCPIETATEHSRARHTGMG